MSLPELSPSQRCFRLFFRSCLCGAVWVRQSGPLGGTKSSETRAEGMQRGIVAPSSSLFHLLVMCHGSWDGSPGWESWAEWQSRFSVLSVPSPAQGRAQSWDWEHRAGEASGTSLAAPSSFTQPRGGRQHLSFFLWTTLFV